MSRDTPQSGTLRDQQRQLTRALILDAGEQLVSTKGFAATTIKDITQTAGISRATFYLHFKGKNDLMGALVEREGAAGLDTYRELDAILEGPRDGALPALREWLAGTLALWREKGPVFIGLLEGMSADPEVADHHVALSPALIDVLEHAPWRGGRVTAAKRDHRRRAVMLEIMTERLLLVVSSGSLEETPDDFVLDFLADLWLRVLYDGGVSSGS